MGLEEEVLFTTVEFTGPPYDADRRAKPTGVRQGEIPGRRGTGR